MSSSFIRSELDARLSSWATSQYPPVPIAFENAAFTKPANQLYLETYLLPARTKNRTVDGTGNKELGVYQINIWYPIGGGMGAIESIESQIVALFPVMPKFSSVSVDRTPSTVKAISDTSGWRVVYVSVYYRYET